MIILRDSCGSFTLYLGLLDWRKGKHILAPEPVKHPWRIWVNSIGINPQKIPQSMNHEYNSWDVAYSSFMSPTLHWHHNGRDGFSNHETQPFTQAQIKENVKLCVTGLCVGNSPVTGEFPHKYPVKRKTFWWRHHDGLGMQHTLWTNVPTYIYSAESYTSSWNFGFIFNVALRYCTKLSRKICVSVLVEHTCMQVSRAKYCAQGFGPGCYTVIPLHLIPYVLRQRR